MGTVPKCNRKIVETEGVSIPLIHVYMTAHLSELVNALQ